MTGSTAWICVATVGAASGVRSTMPLATESWAAATGQLSTIDGLLGRLADLDVAGLLALMAGAEVLADKSGLLPSRTEFGPFEGRLASGALTGAVMAGANRRSRAWGAAIGAASAGISAVLTHRIRLTLSSAGLPDPLVGLVEDLTIFKVSRWATMQQKIARP